MSTFSRVTLARNFDEELSVDISFNLGRNKARVVVINKKGIPMFVFLKRAASAWSSNGLAGERAIPHTWGRNGNLIVDIRDLLASPSFHAQIRACVKLASTATAIPKSNLPVEGE